MSPSGALRSGAQDVDGALDHPARRRDQVQIGLVAALGLAHVDHFDRELDAQFVALGKVQRDQSAFKVKHEPGNPAADANGDVQMPNVNSLVEMVDMREAQRSYEANLNLISSTRRMIQRTIDILRA